MLILFKAYEGLHVSYWDCECEIKIKLYVQLCDNNKLYKHSTVTSLH